MHVYPAFRQLARHGAVLPPVAPKKATLLGEDMMLITPFDFILWWYPAVKKIAQIINIVINFQITDYSVDSFEVKYLS